MSERSTDSSRSLLVEWGSITKAVTAAGIEAASQAELLSYEEPVKDVIAVEGDFSIADLVHHTSGLARGHRGMRGGLLSDPFSALVGYDAASLQFDGPRSSGTFSYSNLGYALLGAVLTARGKDWWAWCRSNVLDPALVSSATLVAEDDLRHLPRGLTGRVRKPWKIGAGPYAPSGGIWSTFSDLQRFADWSLRDPRRRTGWRMEGRATWINGQTRDSGCCILADADQSRAATVHTLSMAPHSADKIALDLLRGEQPLQGRGYSS